MNAHALRKLQHVFSPYIGKHVTHIVRSGKRIVQGESQYEIETRDVILMAFSGCYAMVRRPGKMPYVCDLADLKVFEPDHPGWVGQRGGMTMKGKCPP